MTYNAQTEAEAFEAIWTREGFVAAGDIAKAHLEWEQRWQAERNRLWTVSPGSGACIEHDAERDTLLDCHRIERASVEQELAAMQSKVETGGGQMTLQQRDWIATLQARVDAWMLLRAEASGGASATVGGDMATSLSCSRTAASSQQSQ